MNPADHKGIPAGTLHEQDRDGPVTILRDYDTLLIDRWRLPLEEVLRLPGIIAGVLPDLFAAREEMEAEAEEARAGVEPVDGEGSDFD